MKKTAGVLALLMAMAAGFNAAAESGSGRRTLNIWSWNEEFPTAFERYYADQLPEDVDVVWTIIPTMDYNYQDKLRAALANQDKVAAEDRIDIFMVEPDYAGEFVESNYTLDMYKNGITKDDVADQYPVLRNLMTDKKGALKGVAYYITPAGFIYRRSIAKAVFGKDDPASVGKLMNDWKSYEKAAEKLKKSGYFMTSSYEDTFRCFYNSRESAFVDKNKFKVVKAMEDWVTHEKKFMENGYTKGTGTWSWEWMMDMMSGSNVFGYYAADWLSEYVIKSMDPSTEGDWAICKGPKGFVWGGTCLCAAAGGDNLDLVADIFKKFACDYDFMDNMMNNDDEIMVNNKKVVAAHYGDSRFEKSMLNGQNPLEVYSACAEEADLSYNTKYDMQLISIFQRSMANYFMGMNDLDRAWENYFSEARNNFPELKK